MASPSPMELNRCLAKTPGKGLLYAMPSVEILSTWPNI